MHLGGMDFGGMESDPEFMALLEAAQKASEKNGGEDSGYWEEVNYERKAFIEVPIYSRMEEVRVLPTISKKGVLEINEEITLNNCHAGSDNPEIWVISFTEMMPNMFTLTLSIEHIGCFHDNHILSSKNELTGISQEAPSAQGVLQYLLACMTNPTSPKLSGPPHCPLQVFLAYRLKECYEEVRRALCQANIRCVLEEKAAAVTSARQQGTEYKGRNVSGSCGACGITSNNIYDLKRCGGCGAVYYCNRECQVTHWKAHKADCKKSGGAKGKKKTKKSLN
jgi:hypothetical protein